MANAAGRSRADPSAFIRPCPGSLAPSATQVMTFTRVISGYAITSTIDSLGVIPDGHAILGTVRRPDNLPPARGSSASDPWRHHRRYWVGRHHRAYVSVAITRTNLAVVR